MDFTNSGSCMRVMTNRRDQIENRTPPQAGDVTYLHPPRESSQCTIQYV